MAAFPDLHSLQALFWQLITAPEGVARGVQELNRRGALDGEDLSFLVSPAGDLGPVERLDVYADMYFYRLRDCLSEDFPALAAQLGPTHFHNLVTDYLLAHPPSHFSLRELGRALPEFVAGHTLARERPVLADLARLEWARIDVFDALDAEPLERSELLAAAATGPERVGLRLVPAARLLRLAPAALALWKQSLSEAGGATAAEGGGEAVGALVWRRGFGVFHRSLLPDEEGCLKALAGRAVSVAELGERVLAAQPTDSARAAERLAELLERWAADALLTLA